jgi:hypothetical protein
MKNISQLSQKYINNTLFTIPFLESEIWNRHNFNEDIEYQFSQTLDIWKTIKDIDKLNESQLENKIIIPILENILGFSIFNQISKKTEKDHFIPDFVLFKNDFEMQKEISKDDIGDVERLEILCETKQYNIKLSTGKTDRKKNPHLQLVTYMRELKSDYGFLTNGKYWRFYNLKDFTTAEEKFFEIDLEQILLDGDRESFKYFFHLFKNQEMKQICKLNLETKLQIENDLRRVVYGDDSIFEEIAREIWRNSNCNDFEEIHKNTIYFLFRLLFVSYIEDKFSTLLNQHLFYSENSVNRIFDKLEKISDRTSKTSFYGIKKLRELFHDLNMGECEIGIPLLNGGLFDKENTLLLEQKGIIRDSVLKSVLRKLLRYPKSLFKRDFKALSTTHLGNIYEGLLEYDIREENGILHFLNISTNRKDTASFYTPEEISTFMVEDSIDRQIEKGISPFDIRIIDNSCGSGHFLIQSLNYLTEKSLNIINEEKEHPQKKEIQKLIKNEKRKIIFNIRGFEEKPEISDLAVLKRIILKRSIYGVDLNYFSVELTKLSLWIDSFIFGTPLSYIEHHIKQGNSLIGSSKKELDKYMTAVGSGNLFSHDFRTEYDELKNIYKILDKLNDTTPKEIKKSEKIYSEEISPKLEKLNRALDFLTYKKFLTIEKNKNELNLISNENPDFEMEKLFSGEDTELLEKIETYKKRFLFFNFEIEFPEPFESDRNGFDVIVGNPPWDKTKFDDKDFFSQYGEKNYRKMKNSEKEKFRTKILSLPLENERYFRKKNLINDSNLYYKNYFPNSQGSGDGNLYRFFIERNLSFIAKSGNLTYVTPATIINEDGSIQLRKYLFENFKLNYFYGFENRQKLFKSVDSRFKFAIYGIEQGKTDIVKTRFMETDTSHLYKKTKTERNKDIDYSLEVVKKLSPDSLSFMEVRKKTDLRFLHKVYKNFKPLYFEYFDFRRELDMTNDKSIFQEKYKTGLVPLYEGKMIHQFDSKFGEPSYFLDLKEFDQRLESKEISRMISDLYSQIEEKKATKEKTVLNHLGFKDKSELKQFIKFDREFYRLGYRAIGRNTDERSFISSLIPKEIGIGNSIHVCYPKQYLLKNKKIVLNEIPIEKILFLQSVFNSIVVDFILRFFITANVNKTYIMRLPIPQPTEKELKENPKYKILIKNSLLLTLSHNKKDFEELQKEFSISDSEIPKDDFEREKLKIENDVIVANLYEVTKIEMENILESFKVLKKKNENYLKNLLNEFG